MKRRIARTMGLGTIVVLAIGTAWYGRPASHPGLQLSAPHVILTSTYTGNFNCTPSFPPTGSTVTGNLTVRSGVLCTLDDVTVGGNVMVRRGGALIGHGGSVRGNLKAMRATGILLDQRAGGGDCQTSTVHVGYTVQFRNTPPRGYVVTAADLSALDSPCIGGTVAVSLTQDGSTIASGGPVTITGSTATVSMGTPYPLASDVNDVEVDIASSGSSGSGMSIGGNLILLSSGGIRVTSVSVHKNIHIAKTTGVSEGSPNYVCASSTVGNYILHGSEAAAPFDVGGPNPPCTAGNNIFRNMIIQNNKSSVIVSNDSIGGNLVCTGNSSVTGSNNTARSKIKQCAGL